MFLTTDLILNILLPYIEDPKKCLIAYLISDEKNKKLLKWCWNEFSLEMEKNLNRDFINNNYQKLKKSMKKHPNARIAGSYTWRVLTGASYRPTDIDLFIPDEYYFKEIFLDNKSSDKSKGGSIYPLTSIEKNFSSTLFTVPNISYQSIYVGVPADEIQEWMINGFDMDMLALNWNLESTPTFGWTQWTKFLNGALENRITLRLQPPDPLSFGFKRKSSYHLCERWGKYLNRGFKVNIETLEGLSLRNWLLMCTDVNTSSNITNVNASSDITNVSKCYSFLIQMGIPHVINDGNKNSQFHITILVPPRKRKFIEE